ncbi:MAG: HEAT repeat domain-containing protein, partial [Planctomycetes bacterium]|nr:HEAT repeat domain-containing protein [Planctomycetota bacterium]
METNSDLPDPSLYIGRLTAEDAFFREAAAWSLGEIGNPRAVGPLAGLLLREMSTVERGGYIAHAEVVRACVEALRRLGSPDSLYALVKALCVLTRSRGVDEETVMEIVEALNEVGGPNAVREAADKVVRCARGKTSPPGLH